MKTGNDLISVIIPVWNGARFLASAIESVKRQRYDNVEILVIDDGSTDETRAIAKEFENIIQYIHQPHKGVAAARNLGLSKSRGNIIAFLDADDAWPSYKFDMQLDVLKDESVEMVLGASRFEKTVDIAKGPLGKCGDSIFYYYLSSGLYRRSVFNKVGLFDEQLQLSEDVDWFMRAREIGIKTKILKQETTIWTEHGENISIGKSFEQLGLFHIFKKSVDRRSQKKSLPLFDNCAMSLNQGPLVSVIIPVHNGERFLRAAVSSVLDQTYRPLEIIILDDGSDDDTGEIACSFPEVSYHRQAKAGGAAARNAGISLAKGEFIAILDADDLWAPRKLALQVAFHLEHPEAGYSFTGEKIFLEPGIEQPSWLKTEILMNSHPSFVPSALMIRKNIYEKVGPFDTTYEIVSDADWLLRAKDAGIPSGTLPETLMLKRIHKDNLTHRQAMMRLELMRSFKASVDRRKKMSETIAADKESRS